MHGAAGPGFRPYALACRSVTVLQPGVPCRSPSTEARSSVRTGDEAQAQAQGWKLELAADDGVGAGAVRGALAGAEAQAPAPAEAASPSG